MAAAVIQNTCVISELLSKPFSRRNIYEQNAIIDAGRPCPMILNFKSIPMFRNKKFVSYAYFNTSLYNNTIWLTGSSVLNKLYCWPCLLFSTENSVWSKRGVDNLNLLKPAIRYHEKSIIHIRCFLKMTAFGRNPIDHLHLLDEQRRRSHFMHNENVKKNREILKHMINAVQFLAQQELSLNEHDKSSAFHKRGNFIELLDYTRQYDPILDIYLKEPTTVLGTSSSIIQNDIIDSIGSLITDKLKEELDQADFVALILDETSDMINKSQLSTVLRYIDQNGDVQERFLHFSDISGDRSATALFEHVKNILNNYNCSKKLIAQTYDGATVLAGQNNIFNVKIRELCPCAYFVHCCGQVLNLTLQQSVSNIKQCNIFFQTMSGLSGFFKSSKRTDALQNFVERNLPSVTSTIKKYRWELSSRLVNFVKENYDMLTLFFRKIEEDSNEWDNDSVLKAQGFLYFLKKFSSQFLMNLFSLIFSLTDDLYNILQKKAMDIVYCTNKVDEIIIKLQDIRENGFEKIFNEVSINERSTKKRIKYDNHSYKFLFTKIMDNILVQIKNRFKLMRNLEFFDLLNFDLYEKHNRQFPHREFKCLTNQYGSFFNVDRLQNELKVLYSSTNFKHTPIFDLVKCMRLSKLDLGMKDIYKLAKLIATIPITTVTADKTFLTLNRIKTYSKIIQGQDDRRSSSLAILSIEHKLLKDLKLTTTFYDKVIEKFAERERQIDCTYI